MDLKQALEVLAVCDADEGDPRQPIPVMKVVNALRAALAEVDRLTAERERQIVGRDDGGVPIWEPKP